MKKMKRWIGILLCCAMVLSCLSPVAVFAEESETKAPVTATFTKGDTRIPWLQAIVNAGMGMTVKFCHYQLMTSL